MKVYNLSDRRKNKCSDLRKCPASQYHNCLAFKKGLNCWEQENLPCCRRNDKSRCKACTLYLASLSGLKSQIYPETIHK